MRYFLSSVKGQKNTAGEKAKLDIETILKNNKFKELKFSFPSSKLGKLFLTKSIAKKTIFNLNSNDTIVFQYPIYSGFAARVFLAECKKKSIQIIGVIHDIESLRNLSDQREIKKEIELLNMFSSLIVHNSMMQGWLSKNGVYVPMVQIGVFDYLQSSGVNDNDSQLPLVYAGNLKKAVFLNKWNQQNDIEVFGVSPSTYYPVKVKYMGVESPESLVEKIRGSYGLIWDGDSELSEQSAIVNYTKYNNPHKLSLYISTGLPIIAWKKSAIASFIVDNKIGVVVSTIGEIDEELRKISDQEYVQMLNNVRLLSEKVTNGVYIKKAVDNAINLSKY